MYVVIVSFSDINHGSYSPGQKLEALPDGVDWLKAGFVKAEKPASKKRARTTKKK